MNVAIVMKPKSDIVNLSIWSAGKGTRYVSLGRRKNIILMSLAIVASVALWLGLQVYIMTSNAVVRANDFAAAVSANAEGAKAEQVEIVKPRGWLRQIAAKIAPQETPRSRVVAYDGVRALSRGTKVVLYVNGQRYLAEVAGAPNESVLLRRGSVPERLYVLGDESYAVVANQQSKVVRASDITATVDDAPVQMARN
jgi:hypothetical protein